MNFPETFRVLIITLSDRASKGEYEDLSGPAVKEHCTRFFNAQEWKHNTDTVLIGDDREALEEIIRERSSGYDLLITTGGTGIGPRDITVETVKPLLEKEIPGIMEHIRITYGSAKPNALLSRGVAGVRGKTLVFTLPGSVKAVNEYMTEIVKSLAHAYFMLYAIDNHRTV